MTQMLTNGRQSLNNESKFKLPMQAGVCLKPQHYATILENKPPVGWFEVHAENYLGKGGPPLRYLEEIRQLYPLSIHGVGLSIGSADGLDQHHLQRISALVKRFEPESFSEHLAWSTHDGEFFSDLLPLPYNKEQEDIVCAHINQVQDAIRRPMLLENPSNYLTLESSSMLETQFLCNVLRRTGCGLLLDVNNVYISAQNCGYDAKAYIDALPAQKVGEIHLAGHASDTSDNNEPLLIDAHDREVCDEVWALYDYTLTQVGPTPTLIEWDTAVPEWSVLIDEMNKADALLLKCH